MILLQSLVGDADLYVSSKIMTPTFQLHEHEFHSSTCGTDLVDIDNSMKRPIAIGVYGYPLYPRSEYVMKVIFYEEANEPPETGANSLDSVYLPVDLQEWRHNVTDIFSDDQEGEGHHAKSSLIEIAEILFSILTFLIELVIEMLL